MSDPENILQKAFYLGVGIASYAAEKASDAIQELKQQAQKITVDQDLPLKLQKLADEMVAKGKITTDEARNFVDEMMKQAQSSIPGTSPEENREPRTIEIISDDDDD
jgi:polyhydroxyalkanoate synthesis regulator phasin